LAERESSPLRGGRAEGVEPLPERRDCHLRKLEAHGCKSSVPGDLLVIYREHPGQAASPVPLALSSVFSARMRALEAVACGPPVAQVHQLLDQATWALPSHTVVRLLSFQASCREPIACLRSRPRGAVSLG